jgi:hypothetical protein
MHTDAPHTSLPRVPSYRHGVASQKTRILNVNIVDDSLLANNEKATCFLGQIWIESRYAMMEVKHVSKQTLCKK